MSAEGEWLPVPACARQAGVSTSTLRRHLESGAIGVRTLRLTPRTTRLHRGDWEQWLHAHGLITEAPSSV